MASIHDPNFQPSVPLPSPQWYEQHMQQSTLKDASTAMGLRLTMEQFAEAKPILGAAYRKFNPSNQDYGGNEGRELKLKHARKCLKKYPFLGHGDPGWTVKGLALFMKRNSKNKCVAESKVPKTKSKRKRKSDKKASATDDESDDGQKLPKAKRSKDRGLSDEQRGDKHLKKRVGKEEDREKEERQEKSSKKSERKKERRKRRRDRDRQKSEILDSETHDDDTTGPAAMDFQTEGSFSNVFELGRLRESLPPATQATPTMTPTPEVGNILLLCDASGPRTEVNTHMLRAGDWYNHIKEEMLSQDIITSMDHKDIYVRDPESRGYGLRTHAQVVSAVAKVQSRQVSVYAQKQPQPTRETTRVRQMYSMSDPQKRRRSSSTEAKPRANKFAKLVASHPSMVDNGSAPAIKSEDIAVGSVWNPIAVDADSMEDIQGVKPGSSTFFVEPWVERENTGDAESIELGGSTFVVRTRLDEKNHEMTDVTGDDGADPHQRAIELPDVYQSGSSVTQAAQQHLPDTPLRYYGVAAVGGGSAVVPPDASDAPMEEEMVNDSSSSDDESSMDPSSEDDEDQYKEDDGNSEYDEDEDEDDDVNSEDENEELHDYEDDDDANLGSNHLTSDNVIAMWHQRIEDQQRADEAHERTVDKLESRNVLARVNQEELELAQYLFPMITRDQLTDTERVSLPLVWGLNPGFKPYPYQLLSCSTGLRQECSPIRGGLLGDDCGVGKTIQLLLKIIVHKLVEANAAEVEAWWKQREAGRVEGEHHHLPRSRTNDTELCPTRCTRPIACWCEPRMRSVAEYTGFRGPYLVITPKPGLKGFDETVTLMLDGSKFAKAHDLCVSILPGESKKPETYRHKPLSRADVPRYCPGYDLHQEKAYTVKHAQHTYQKKQMERTWEIKCTSNEAFNRVDISKPKTSPMLILMTTPDVYASSLPRLFKIKTSVTGTVPIQACKAKTAYWEYWVVAFGYVLWDECHRGTTGTRQADLKHLAEESCLDANFKAGHKLWGATGTPDSDPQYAVAWYIRMLKKDSWKRIKKGPYVGLALAPGKDSWKKMVRECMATIRRVDYNVEHATLVTEKAYTEFTKIYDALTPLIQLRRKLTTLWYNKQPLSRMRSRLQEVAVPVTPQKDELLMMESITSAATTKVVARYQEQMQQWKSEPEGVRKPTLFSKSDGGFTLVTAMASIPQFGGYFVRKLVKPESPETSKFVRTNKVLVPLLKDPLGERMLEIEKEIGQQFGAKMEALHQLLERIRTTPRQDGKKAKVVVASSWPMTTLLLKLCIWLWYGEQAVYYTSDLKDDELANSFNKFEDEDNNKWIMIATVQSMGVGLNLQCANAMILLEPLSNPSTKHQLFSRICRLGQTEPIVYGYTLYNEASSVETLALKKAEGGKALGAELDKGEKRNERAKESKAEGE